MKKFQNTELFTLKDPHVVQPMKYFTSFEIQDTRLITNKS